MRPRRKTAWSFLEKLNTEVSYGPAIPFLNLGAEKITTQNDTCTLIFQGSTIYNSQDTESTKMSIDRKMKTMRCICTLECYSAIKQNEIRMLAGARIVRETITLQILSREERTNILRYHIQVGSIRSYR